MVDILKILAENRKVKVGVFFAVFALLLSLLAVNSRSESRCENGFLWPNQTIRIKGIGSTADGELELSFVPSNSFDNRARVSILDRDDGVIKEVVLNPGEEESMSLDSAAVSLKGAQSNPGRISYSYEINYSVMPYSLLSIPALFLTFFGIFLIYKGVEEDRSNRTRGERRSEAKDEEEEGSDMDFMGIEKGRDEE